AAAAFARASGSATTAGPAGPAGATGAPGPTVAPHPGRISACTRRGARIEIAMGCRLLRGHLDAVVEILDARDRIGDVLRTMLHPACWHLALEHHAALFAAHLDVGGVDDRIIAKTFVHFFQDARIRTGVAARASAPIAALPLRAAGLLPALRSICGAAVRATRPDLSG